MLIYGLFWLLKLAVPVLIQRESPAWGGEWSKEGHQLQSEELLPGNRAQGACVFACEHPVWQAAPLDLRRERLPIEAGWQEGAGHCCC